MDLFYETMNDLKAVNYFRKKLHLKCLTGFRVCLYLGWCFTFNKCSFIIQEKIKFDVGKIKFEFSNSDFNVPFFPLIMDHLLQRMCAISSKKLTFFTTLYVDLCVRLHIGE